MERATPSDTRIAMAPRSGVALEAAVGLPRFAPVPAEALSRVETDQSFSARLRKNLTNGVVRGLSPALVLAPHWITARGNLPQVHGARMQTMSDRLSPVRLVEPHLQGADIGVVAHPWPGTIVLVLCGTASALALLAVYALMLRRSAARLRIEHDVNQLLLDAFNRTDAAVAIFDRGMQAVHWNGGLESRFPGLVSLFESGTPLEKCCAQSYVSGEFETDMGPQDISVFATTTRQRLHAGDTVQRLLHTRDGSNFDLSMFRLGTQHYAAVWLDVSRLHHQHEHLSDQHRELIRANQNLLAFSSMAAHDLKAPLVQQSVLMEFILEDMAEAGLDLPKSLQGHFSILTDLTRRMNRLVSDLLDYAKADTDRGSPKCFAPNARMTSVLQLAAQGPHMVVEIEPDMPDVEVDPTSFDLVMRNLISNAAKHHDRADGRIKLRAYRREDEVVIEVEDDGPGIAPAQRTQVFEPFARLTRVEGSGLGLALVEKTVIAWGGSISLRAAPGRGCIFAITLPSASKHRVELAKIPHGMRGPQPRHALGLT
ncbi:sensor histidine kinase [Sulfitobacter sp.]|uniref:sensor histidine kinase n=1 Tax=Sulfitobacter sp. TaxID=1903071 RepID=UPI0030021C16